MITEKPELLMPAGSLTKLRTAFDFGADAAYVGVPLFSLRARENEFDLEALKQAISEAHSRQKKIYVTANIFARNRKINAFARHVEDWIQLKPDAFIMSDPGLMMMVREKHPDVPIHLSVQANCMNWQSVKFWREKFGLERVILSRELNVNEIREIRERVPDIELEAFVHGSLCIAYSGRCLLSSYFSVRDANQGVCDNSCREKFQVYETPDVEVDRDFYLEDLRNRGEFYRIEEDTEGTYIMNSKDLCMIEHLDQLRAAGVCSFKVEGRTKSEYYVGVVARSYRHAIDDLAAGKAFNKDLLEDLKKVAHRGYSTGFMINNPGSEAQKYDTGLSRYFTQKFAGVVVQSESPDGYWPMEVRNKLKVGDAIEILDPDKNSSFDAVIESLQDQKRNVVETAHGGTGMFFVRTDRRPRAPSLISLKSSAGSLS